LFPGVENMKDIKISELKELKGKDMPDLIEALDQAGMEAFFSNGELKIKRVGK